MDFYVLYKKQHDYIYYIITVFPTDHDITLSFHKFSYIIMVVGLHKV